MKYILYLVANWFLVNENISMAQQCVCACVFVYMACIGLFKCRWLPLCIYAHVHVETQKLTLIIFLNLSSHYSLRQGLSVNPELTNSDQSSQPSYSQSLLLGSGNTDNYQASFLIYIGSANLNSSPHTCEASNLSTQATAAKRNIYIFEISS